MTLHHATSTRFSRREVLCRIGGGIGGLALATMFADSGLLASEQPGGAVNPLAPKPPHFLARAKRLIFLFMNGGPSHVDTFDPKPELTKFNGQSVPESIAKKLKREPKGKLMGSPFKTIACGSAGTQITELYPEVGRQLDEICLLRSVYTDNPNHEPGLLMMNSGNMQPIRPSMGSWITYALGSDNQDLPGYIVFCPGKPVVGPQLWSNSFLPGIYQGTQINNKSIDPKTIIRDVNNRYLSAAEQRSQLDLLQQMNHLHLEQRAHDDQLEARIASLEMAFRMQGEAQEVFDVGKESAEVRKLYGDGEFAQACLLSRRLVERGVRVVQIYYGNGQPWDDHKDIHLHRDHAQKTDRPIAALIRDLKALGMLDETLIVWGGEFGRTPTSQGATGRDHHSTGFSMWMAGGGVKGGLVYGATDELGYTAIEKPLHVHDLHATILHLMGLDHERLTFRYGGRDFRLTDVHGHVAHEIVA